eukprot:CAMPEP_0172037122 /NCGR_PEP_ID=MMETSP1041-20130122/22560_1 /TAXON_ID=464988 /ORGANISM="Hemiselmis andersenii, Strain CCMP439" /LENGTH=66 /DNA_ID=CAMNT_0012694459 /DNA_START=13 /DNA_END=213 /DNA_ORIENTATION=+
MFSSLFTKLAAPIQRTTELETTSAGVVTQQFTMLHCGSIQQCLDHTAAHSGYKAMEKESTFKYNTK